MLRCHQHNYFRQLVWPAAFLIITPIVFQYLAANIAQADAMARGLAGPISWPRFALYGVFLCAAGWFVQNWLRTRRHRAAMAKEDYTPPVAAVSEPESMSEGSNEILIWIGMGLTLLYGFLLPVVGYPVATAGYLVLWLLLGGIRKPLLISMVTVLGTVLLLFVFVKLALMPLDRGHGMFGEFTVAMYRFLHIY